MARMLLPIGSIPHKSPCHGGGICGALIGVAGAMPSLLHTLMVLSSKIVHFTPAREDQQRLVIRIAQKDPFQPVVVGMTKNGAERINP